MLRESRTRDEANFPKPELPEYARSRTAVGGENIHALQEKISYGQCTGVKQDKLGKKPRTHWKLQRRTAPRSTQPQYSTPLYTGD